MTADHVFFMGEDHQSRCRRNRYRGRKTLRRDPGWTGRTDDREARLRDREELNAPVPRSLALGRSPRQEATRVLLDFRARPGFDKEAGWAFNMLEKIHLILGQLRPRRADVFSDCGSGPTGIHPERGPTRPR